MGISTQHQPAGCHRHSPADQGVELCDQDLGIDDDAIANHAGGLRLEDAAWDQVEHQCLAIHHESVAGIVAALEAGHVSSAPGQEIDDLSLALVSPL